MKDSLEEIYNSGLIEKDNPFLAWLENTNEDQLVIQAIAKRIPELLLSQNPEKEKKILDIGCSCGSTSFRLIEVLNSQKINFTYYALEPFAEQIKIFKQLATKKGINNIEFITDSVDNYQFREFFDLVFIGHSLYYVDDPLMLIKRIIASSRETIIVHQGNGGINKVQADLRRLINSNFHINLTFHNLLEVINNISADITVNTDIINSTADISTCRHPESKTGRNLITFMLDRDYNSLSEKDKKEINSYFKANFPDKMTNEIGIIYIK